MRSSSASSRSRRAAPLGLARVLRLALELDAGALGERLERGREVEPLGLHHELEHVAARAAAEAVVELLDRVDRRTTACARRGTGTARSSAAGRRGELGARADQLDEVDGVADALARVVGVARPSAPQTLRHEALGPRPDAKRSVMPAR